MSRILSAAMFLAVIVPMLVYWTSPAMSDVVHPSVPNFTLFDEQGQNYTLENDRDQKAIVIVVQGNGCPIVRKSISYLNDLKNTFADRDITFVMINSNSQDDRDSIVQEAADFHIQWPILVDSAQVAARALHIKRTAEAFIIDPRTMTMIYRGPIYDKLGYEVERKTISQEYLKDQLTAFLNGQPLNAVTAPVKGCLVSIMQP